MRYNKIRMPRVSTKEAKEQAMSDISKYYDKVYIQSQADIMRLTDFYKNNNNLIIRLR